MRGINLFKSASITAVLAGSLIFGGAAAVLAQDEAPEGTPDIAHPAHIHSGTCGENLDPNPLQPLNDIIPYANDDNDDNKNSPQGVLTAPLVLQSETDVDMEFDDLLAEPHAINVHESTEKIENYIACGDIGGIVVDDGDKLAIGLSPLNDSGIYGIAFLEKDDGKTKVEIWLAEPRIEETPAATPVS